MTFTNLILFHADTGMQFVRLSRSLTTRQQQYIGCDYGAESLLIAIEIMALEAALETSCDLENPRTHIPPRVDS